MLLQQTALTLGHESAARANKVDTEQMDIQR